MVNKRYAMVRCGALLRAFRTLVGPGCSVGRQSCMTCGLDTILTFEMLQPSLLDPVCSCTQGESFCLRYALLSSSAVELLLPKTVPLFISCMLKVYSLKPSAVRPHCVCLLYCTCVLQFFFTSMWPCCIVTNFFIIKPTRCTNFTNLFWHETLHVSDISSVHHQEFIHSTLSNGMCHTGL
jgi:hypothetical protein